MDNNDNIPFDLVGCPQCDAPAEIIDRFELPSTDGPVEHVTVQCLFRHWFTVTAARLAPVRPVPGSVSGEERVR